MTLAALELNDPSLLIQAEDDARHAEPGFARLTPTGIVTGEEARAVAWREPQHMYNQYWCHLNQTPLANRHRFARHHADIAFAQMRNLWQQAGEPEALMLLAPGSFTDVQLSLMLGMVDALPARTDAVIDSALASCLDAETDTLHLELHLHETVVTVCRPHNGTLRVEDQEVFAGIGMSQIQNTVARHISDVLVDSYRFDPLHSSATEQAIYDQIPHWLARLGWEQDVSIKLASDHGELPCLLRGDAVKPLIARRLAGILQYTGERRDCRLSLSHGSGVLAGLMSEFADARVARRTAGTRRALARHAAILDQEGELLRLRALQRTAPGKAAARVNGEATATHLLCGELALPLDSPVSIRLAENGARMHNGIDSDAALTVVLRDHALQTLHGTADASLPRECRPGDTIHVGGHELKLIRVPQGRTR